MLFKSLHRKTACLGYIISYGWSVGKKYGFSLDL